MAPTVTIPRRIPLLMISGDVLLPGGSMRIPITHPSNLDMLEKEVMTNNALCRTVIGVFAGDVVVELQKGIQPIGTAAVVVQVLMPSRSQKVASLLVTGLCRIRVDKVESAEPYFVGSVTQLDKLSNNEEEDPQDFTPEHTELVSEFRKAVNKVIEQMDKTNPDVEKLKAMLYGLPEHHLIDLVTSLLRGSMEEKRGILNAVNMTDRFRRVLTLLTRLDDDLNSSPPVIIRGNIRRLPQSLIPPKTLRTKVLSQLTDGDDEIADLEKKLKEAGMPPEASKVAMTEMDRLKRSPRFGPDTTVSRNYLELMAELPWSKTTQETLDIHKARKDLDADHYAMDKLKRRVLEYLAVRQLKSNMRGPILCFVGPPGVGKTSVGRSIAQTIGREFYRISLGGVCNQSDIRGHRRTYIGAIPGRIIHGLKTVGVRNPVFLLDEIDKLSSGGVQGDPGSALLEVLDPEQNCCFVDHYVNVPFDLSQVMFICTANSTKTIPPALLDRMEVIHVPGYTQEEKLHIATRHLLPKQLEAHALTSELIGIPEDSIDLIISEYTREAGVRTLERKLGALCRAVAVQVAESKFSSSGEASPQPVTFPVEVNKRRVEEILGPAVYLKNDLWSRLGHPGVAAGLAWTTVGGEVMLVEACKMEGDGELVLTGHLGDVMKESARLALNWVRTQGQKYGLKVDGDTLARTDMHIHFPAGAVGKDGPSAGITIATALMSLFGNKPVASDVAMSGEITLQGIVLPVGGVKEKVLAAHRAGLKRIILPQMNEKDLLEIPDSLKNDLKFVFVTHINDVLQAAFEGGFPVSTRPDILLVNKL